MVDAPLAHSTLYTRTGQSGHSRDGGGERQEPLALGLAREVRAHHHQLPGRLFILILGIEIRARTKMYLLYFLATH